MSEGSYSDSDPLEKLAVVCLIIGMLAWATKAWWAE